MNTSTTSAEVERLRDQDWKDWGPYLTERAWGTVREDSADDNQPWKHVPFDHARSRAFRWCEDGLAGFCDSEQRLCMALGLWNERDAILKERLFGLTNEEGNHGEDAKELYVFMDGLPSHAYMKALYIYPQVAFPYDDLRQQNDGRSRDLPEYELTDALKDTLAECRYFSIYVEYAKASPTDVFCRITAINRGPDAAPLHLLPHLWFRNTWTWNEDQPRPELALDGAAVQVKAEDLKPQWWYVMSGDHKPRWLFTDNETNNALLFGGENAARYTKDGIGDAVVQGQMGRIHPERRGTRCAAHFSATVAPGETMVVLTRLTDSAQADPFARADALFAQRIREADEFYAAIQRPDLTDDERRVQRQAFAGLCWSKTFYHFDVDEWLEGARKDGADAGKLLNKDWSHLRASDTISVPDKWEYPWFAAWDQIFQAITIGMIDIEFAKEQVTVLLNDRYQHPDGQIPSFEGNFNLSNPPVHAWGALHLYRWERDHADQGDVEFLRHVFHKLLLNYGWWFTPRSFEGHSPLEGGFLGMDNITVFDRSQPPDEGYVIQADSFGWLGIMTLCMLEIAVELAQHDPVYEDEALHFLSGLQVLIDWLHKPGHESALLWHEEDSFFYDLFCRPNHEPTPLRVRSYVGLIPFAAVTTLDQAQVDKLPKLKDRLDAFSRTYADHIHHYTDTRPDSIHAERISLALLIPERLNRILATIANPDEFLSQYGLRSLSRYHAEHPFSLQTEKERYIVGYEPGEARSELLGGNSNWRGPIWAPINLLVIEALRKYEQHCGGSLQVENPDGKPTPISTRVFADVLGKRIVSIFLRDGHGRRPEFGDTSFYHEDPHWGDSVLFFEHFHGDQGYGLGASHQNGWTALIAKLIQDCGAV